MYAVRSASLVAVLLLASIDTASGADLPNPIVVEDGTDGRTKFYIRLTEQVSPGTSVVRVRVEIGEEGAIITLVEYYYAGISQSTIHLFKITRELTPRPGRETDRRPILLPLDPSGSASLLIRPHPGRPFTIRLRRSSDGVSLSASVVK